MSCAASVWRFWTIRWHSAPMASVISRSSESAPQHADVGRAPDCAPGRARQEVRVVVAAYVATLGVLGVACGRRHVALCGRCAECCVGGAGSATGEGSASVVAAARLVVTQLPCEAGFLLESRPEVARWTAAAGSRAQLVDLASFDKTLQACHIACLEAAVRVEPRRAEPIFALVRSMCDGECHPLPHDALHIFLQKAPAADGFMHSEETWTPSLKEAGIKIATTVVSRAVSPAVAASAAQEQTGLADRNFVDNI